MSIKSLRYNETTSKQDSDLLDKIASITEELQDISNQYNDKVGELKSVLKDVKRTHGE